MTAQPLKLSFGLDSLRDHRQPQRLCHLDNVRRDVFILQCVNKGFIDLQNIDLKILQVAQAGVAGAEIVDIDRVPRPAKLGNGRGADFWIGKAALGDLKGNLLGAELPAGQQRAEQRGEALRHQIAGIKIDRDVLIRMTL